MLEVVIPYPSIWYRATVRASETDYPKTLGKIEKQDTWYESDLKILNTILFSFPIEHLHLITEKSCNAWKSIKLPTFI